MPRRVGIFLEKFIPGKHLLQCELKGGKSVEEQIQVLKQLKSVSYVKYLDTNMPATVTNTLENEVRIEKDLDKLLKCSEINRL